MLPLCCTFRRRTVPIRCGSHPSRGLGVGHHDVAIYEGVIRRPGETAIQPSLLHFDLSISGGAPAGPRRLENLSRRDVAGFGPDAGMEVPLHVVPAENKAAHQTY